MTPPSPLGSHCDLFCRFFLLQASLNMDMTIMSLTVWINQRYSKSVQVNDIDNLLDCICKPFFQLTLEVPVSTRTNVCNESYGATQWKNRTFLGMIIFLPVWSLWSTWLMIGIPEKNQIIWGFRLYVYLFKMVIMSQISNRWKSKVVFSSNLLLGAGFWFDLSCIRAKQRDPKESVVPENKKGVGQWTW